MNLSLSAPGTTETLHASSVLVLAPHFDDEVLGCGGLLTQLVHRGAAARVLFLSDSRGGGETMEEREAYGQRRAGEARQAAEVLGLAGIDRLDLPDGALDQHMSDLSQGIRRAILTFKPDLLLVTSPLEASVDHRAAFRAVHRVMVELRTESEDLWGALEILAYEVNQPLYPNLLVDVSAEVPRLEEAMACYVSQQERHDYLASRLGLLRFRGLTLGPESRSVEAYRRLRGEDFATRSPARLIAELGGAPGQLEVTEGPRISVIVRTRDRPELLAEALESLARSTYRRAEVVVVNDGGATPELPSGFPLELSRLDFETNRGRSAAANAGMAAATGDVLTFLDDDDLVEPEHLATLAGLASGAGVRVAYTDAAVGVYRLGDGGWRCEERRLPYSRDFDPDLLLFDNYIPFNTLVIDRRLAREVGELDSDLAFFEDWDFLIRLAALTPFHHLARVTCEYRQFRGAGHHILGDRPRERDDFLEMKARIFKKHGDRHSAELTARVIDLLRAEAVAEHEESGRLRAESRTREARFHELNGRLQAMEIHQKTLEESRKTLEESRQALEQSRKNLEEARARDLVELERERQVHRDLDREVARLHERELELVEHLEREQAAHGDLAERLQLMTEQEAKLASELRQTYAEGERLSALIQGKSALIQNMESTRAWRVHQWWQAHKW